MTLNWKNIRPLNGNQDKGFEELCCQLARDKKPIDAEFIRKGTPDAGVECFAILPTGDEWGWQSKFFFTISNSQWSQIDKSVNSALAGHPKLVRYYVCLPIDLPDGRVEKSNSARHLWETHVLKWENWATRRNMRVEFVLWDSSLMLNDLVHPKHRGRVMFWFGSQGCFDDDWFQSNLERTIKSAGPRYSPELHVELPIARQFDAFGRTKEMVGRVKGTGEKIRESSRRIQWWSDSECTPGLGSATEPLRRGIDALFCLLDDFSERPIGSQGLRELVNSAAQILAAIDGVEAFLDGLAVPTQNSSNPASSEKESAYERTRARREMIHTLRILYGAVNSAAKLYEAEAVFAEVRWMVLTGEAGTGKTHLLCDVAMQRLKQRRPTVLLLGQAFTTTDSPARQTVSQLDLPACSLEELIGCLEAAAQAYKSRCLVLIDALNEGMGRQLWGAHLSAFLATVTQSEWLAVAVSIRTCYLDEIVPEDLLACAAHTSHQGFDEVQTEAARSFFRYHNLEFASAPVFSPEFSNPLFLKTLCRGLKEAGFHALPRGFHGITKVFNLYLTSLEKVLAKRLDYHSKNTLVLKSLESFALATAEKKVTWLFLEEGQEVINRALPGRDYSKSLYKALVDEGLLMEGLTYQEGIASDTVCIAYERWADHLTARALLDRHLDNGHPAVAFRSGAPLDLLDKGSIMPAGMIEALSIQLPERVGRELISLVPSGLHRPKLARAFLKSVVWRDPGACTPAMLALLNYYKTRVHPVMDDVWETLVVVATVPDHAVNIEYINRWLWAIPMADRDADWSVAIHKAWDSDGSIHHLVDWAWTLERESVIEEDSAWLASLTLCWCFTSSHRYLRDRATKAVVNLLNGRLNILCRIVAHFAGVNDLYVWERVLAVACGVTLRSNDRRGVERVAETVYQTVFASGKAPVHLLLRDYARSVIERAVNLGCSLTFELRSTCPPYVSEWPLIPSKEEIEAIEGSWEEIGRSKPDEEWARHSIFRSVEGGDFGRYVVGTNSWSTSWLSVDINEPRWKSVDIQIEEFIQALPRREQVLWALAERARKGMLRASFAAYPEIARSLSHEQIDSIEKTAGACSVGLEAAMQKLRASLDDSQAALLEELLINREKSGCNNAPRFDLHLIQRYVLKRVFELGWTVEHFGEFDRHYIDRNRAGRSANKAERLGKKYQWIAYHEISALVADHFQYFDRYEPAGLAMAYVGAWQGRFRNLDPTCCDKSFPLKRKNSLFSSGEWTPVDYDNWENERAGKDWALDATDFPSLRSFFRVTDSRGVAWLNAFGVYLWERKHTPSEDYEHAEHRKLWLKFHAFLVRASDAEALRQWTLKPDVVDQWIESDLPDVSRLFFGEHGVSEASRLLEHMYDRGTGWERPAGCSVEVFSIPVKYSDGPGDFDCSMDEHFCFRLPCAPLVRDWNLQWTGTGADFANTEGVVVAIDPSAHNPGDNVLLLREDELLKYMNAQGLTMVWAVRAEKERIGPEFRAEVQFWTRFSGIFVLSDGNFEGELSSEQNVPG